MTPTGPIIHVVHERFESYKYECIVALVTSEDTLAVFPPHGGMTDVVHRERLDSIEAWHELEDCPDGWQVP